MSNIGVNCGGDSSMPKTTTESEKVVHWRSQLLQKFVAETIEKQRSSDLPKTTKSSSTAKAAETLTTLSTKSIVPPVLISGKQQRKRKRKPAYDLSVPLSLVPWSLKVRARRKRNRVITCDCHPVGVWRGLKLVGFLDPEFTLVLSCEVVHRILDCEEGCANWKSIV